MNRFGNTIKELRNSKSLPLRIIAAYLDIDQAILSKIENGHRKISREKVLKLASFFEVPENELLVLWLADKVTYEIMEEDLAVEALQVAEQEILYHKNKDSLRYRVLNQELVIKTIREYLQTQDKICKAWLFGSYARGDAEENSDIDLLIDVIPDSGFTLFDMAEIQFQLEARFNKKVDVVMAGAGHPLFKSNIENDLKLIYETSPLFRQTQADTCT